MKVVRFGEKYDTPVALALGFFDCVHKGHAAVISAAAQRAEKCGAECAVFTFSNDPGTYLSKQKRIYTFEERLAALEALGVEHVVAAEFEDEFAALGADDFLFKLLSTLNIVGVAAGEDYSYGARAAGRADSLKRRMAKEGIPVDILPLLQADGKKISSTDVKTALAAGDILLANELLTQPYFMLGRVSHAHGRGSTFGYPTANILPDGSRLLPACGVYATSVSVDGKVYPGGTNVGAKPTFGDDITSVETFIIDFDGDIYGKEIKLAFYDKLRDIKKFPSADALARQLDGDVASIRKLFAEKTYES